MNKEQTERSKKFIKTKKPQTVCKVIMEVNLGEEHKGEGKTIEDALASINIPYTDIKTKGFVTFKSGKYTIRKFFATRQMRRILVSNLFQKMWSNLMYKHFEIMKKKEIFNKEMLDL